MTAVTPHGLHFAGAQDSQFQRHMSAFALYLPSSNEYYNRISHFASGNLCKSAFLHHLKTDTIVNAQFRAHDDDDY